MRSLSAFSMPIPRPRRSPPLSGPPLKFFQMLNHLIHELNKQTHICEGDPSADVCFGLTLTLYTDESNGNYPYTHTLFWIYSL